MLFSVGHTDSLHVCVCVCVGACRTNNSDNYVVEQSSGLQLDNLSKVSGKELFKDSQYMVRYLFRTS